ncbi:putative heat shock protein YegD [Candidatus Rhodobacter oscarellae]|uniref:Putative heat shock protein YegD n=1 Tax=Candidatus Rhodobacter oscarellae TaxID=1675527 RepID=A0A0J9EBD4_9RHOB|nr:Hsp70 family protein [Candidatus Rhodobacter lobularis]KMW59004.1 putative heat shock protein YegD [Candidatus Rhodobacter lobularis]
MARLAIDFGTSNTAAALPDGRIVPLEPGASTMPTALFFDPYSKEVLFGSAAVAALIEGREGRFLRALKSVLGNPLLRESRVLGGARTTLLDVVARFLTRAKEQSEAALGSKISKVVSGRPVRFHSKDAARNAQAAVDLEEAYHRAGFTDVAFLPEPEAAALACGGVAEGHGLVVDIGGGTSDYSVFRGQGDGIEVIANYGIRLGGTDFDRLLNIDRVMPQLGLGSMIRNEMGAGQNEAPRALFRDLATWEKIPFQYTPQTLRDVKHMARLAVDPGPWERLVTVLEMELAHDIAHAVEAAKIDANGGDASGIDVGFLRKGARFPLDAGDVMRVLADPAAEIAEAAKQALTSAKMTPSDITRVVMVGGSSLMQGVENAVRAVFPDAEIDRSDAFTAIVDGLAIAAARMD